MKDACPYLELMVNGINYGYLKLIFTINISLPQRSQRQSISYYVGRLASIESMAVLHIVPNTVDVNETGFVFGSPTIYLGSVTEVDLHVCVFL